jgi:methylenetetrahydrofolate reductase (NADPH)
VVFPWLAMERQVIARGRAELLPFDVPRGRRKLARYLGGDEGRWDDRFTSYLYRDPAETGIGVAGYPEKHPEAPDADSDLRNLKRKVDAGADAVFTQLFFVNENFLRFRDAVDRAGIPVPLVPGIMPITEFARIKRITAMCGAIFPRELASRLEAVQEDKQAQFEIGVEHAIRQCQELIDCGVPGMHFYVLNKSEACERILDALQLPAAVDG